MSNRFRRASQPTRQVSEEELDRFIGGGDFSTEARTDTMPEKEQGPLAKPVEAAPEKPVTPNKREKKTARKTTITFNRYEIGVIEAAQDVSSRKLLDFVRAAAVREAERVLKEEGINIEDVNFPD